MLCKHDRWFPADCVSLFTYPVCYLFIYGKTAEMKASVLLLNIKLRLCCSFMENTVVLLKYSKKKQETGSQGNITVITEVRFYLQKKIRESSGSTQNQILNKQKIKEWWWNKCGCFAASLIKNKNKKSRSGSSMKVLQGYRSKLPCPIKQQTPLFW